MVWNDDEIAPFSGFPMHGHRDMAIVTYVREGVLQHEDSSSGVGEIRAGNVQAITAGRGIRHSEYISVGGHSTNYFGAEVRVKTMAFTRSVNFRQGIEIGVVHIAIAIRLALSS